MLQPVNRDMITWPPSPSLYLHLKDLSGDEETDADGGETDDPARHLHHHKRNALEKPSNKGTLIKKKTKFSSFIRKSRKKRVQSHLWQTASSYMTKYWRTSSYIRKPFLIYDFATAHIWIPYRIYEENFIFFFYQCAGTVLYIPKETT